MGASDTTMQFPLRQAICESHGEFTSSCVHRGKGPNGREYWTECPTCTDALRKAAEGKREREFAESQAQARQASLERNLQRVGIPHRFKAKTLGNFEADTEGKTAAFKVATDFVSDFDRHADEGTTIVFSGRPGTGKSHLACAMAAAVAATGHTALYATAREIVLMLRDTWRDGSTSTERQVRDELVNIAVLVIDEVGVGFGSEGEKTQFFDIIDGRYREMMPTILLTNLDKKGLGDYIGQRAFDRLREGGIWVPFDWDSYRGRKP